VAEERKTDNQHQPRIRALRQAGPVVDESRREQKIRDCHPFNRVFPEFKEYASRTKYEGDLLDKESYLKLFKECDTS